MTISAEDQIIHHLKDRVGLAEADRLVAELKRQREAMYEAGENSGYADWDNALDGLLPDDVEPLPTQVAEYVRKLQQENARLRAATEQ
ncbi:hypothetical protein [Streptomyces anulatus]|uniref:hypothetical protein n=1 Tax=Streptomyces anulatus TaxID=1892 RepID=UPI002E16602E|nr:hypothetical protein OG557_38700 [Streptomyces anulatus]